MGKRRPDHAKNFRGGAKNIPEREVFMLPYQSAWIKDESIMKLMEKSRRIGISYGTAYAKARKHSRKDNANDTWSSSRDEPSARLFKKDCAIFAKALNAGARDLGAVVLDDEGNKAQILEFANGTSINCLSSNPDAFAGKGGDVVLDEMALRKDVKGVFDIAGPSIDWGGQLEMISTHRGTGNYFNVLIREIVEKDNPKGISHHRVTLEDALDQHFLWKLQTKLRASDPRMEMDEQAYFDYQRGRASDEETFKQEYMCQPADDAGAFLEYSLIDACTYAPDVEWEFSLADAQACQNPLFAGIDIGRVNDLTSMTILEKIGGHYFKRKRIDLQGWRFSLQEKELYPWAEVCRRVCVDNTGLGMQFAERMQEKFGKYRIEPVTFSGPVKEELAYPVRSAFEDRGISIPFGDKILEADLRAVRKETTSSGNIRFTAERNEGGHADRFWGLALAIHAGGAKQSVWGGGLC